MGGHAELLRRLFTAFAEGDGATIQAAMAPGIRWHTPGGNLLAGDPEGRDAVLAQLRRSAELTGGTYRVEVLDVLEGVDHAAVVYRGTGQRDGRDLDLLHVALYAIAGRQVHEVWIAPLDQAAFDAAWA